MTDGQRDKWGWAAAIVTFILCAAFGPTLSDGNEGTLSDFIVLTGSVTLSWMAYKAVGMMS